ncbi:MAG: serine/threonine protein kinase [Acidobacteria bacterium]|nr:MAG: serine/threonine protein kinase [Acidobacteriota bacterium]REK03922.1 MAG: serine/threonine protein kinase [Acidobacteriota bacterium]REK15084.1 MAG: serine/threonine protein kinase [Acidobacteriota bacterium]REK46174.1 MAG: serine/threonine protein kinase [Acidobacteriota bacterium]
MNDGFKDKVIADKYRIDSYLGASRSGSLYRGTHLLIGSSVTIKVLDRDGVTDESAAAGFSAEARAVSKIAHPNVLNITDFGQDVDGTIYAVLEDSSGESLAERIEEEGPMLVVSAVRIIRQIASALSSSRSRGLHHGSLAASKVLLTRVGDTGEMVKIFDIGSFGSLPRNSDTTNDLDELAYTAPELFVYGTKPDERSDVYSLGVLIYEMLAGEKPFSGDTENELMQRHNQVPPPPLVAFRSDLPEGLETVILEALAKDPAKRYATADEFVDALNAVIDDEGSEEAIVVPVGADSSAGNNIWKTAFIVLAGISILAFGLIYYTNSGQMDPATVLQTDANSQPVQPLNPATGMPERNGLASAPQVLAADPDSLPQDIGGDGYDPWANPGTPPAGAPTPIGPGGDYVTIPGEGSVFMPGVGDVILVPKIVTPTPTPDGSPSATPKPANTNTQPPKPDASQPPKETKPTPAETGSGNGTGPNDQDGVEA